MSYMKGNPHIRSYQDDAGKWRWSVIWFDSVMAISPKSYDDKAECDKMAGAMTACVVDIGRRKLIEIQDKFFPSKPNGEEPS